MELFKSELERLWKNKLTLLCFVLIPLAIIGASKYYLKNNLNLPITSPEYTSFGNYSFMMFQEMLPSLFNFFAILLACISITEEYRKGQFRIIMIRGYSFKEIYFAKVASIVITLIIYFVAYFLVSMVVGWFIAPKIDRVTLFFHNKTVNNVSAIFYSLKYYALGFITIVSMLSVFNLFAINFKSSTGTIAGCMCFLIGSFIFSDFIMKFVDMFGTNLAQNHNFLNVIYKVSLSTIPYIQYKGICEILAQRPVFTHWILGVLAAYIIIFTFITNRIFVKRDHFI